jgi:hypothetical protein
MNGLDFLSFTLKSIPDDVKPYLVSNLELMINSVFFMQSFILCLNFLQLFPDYLVYLLYPMDELQALSSFIYSFESTSLPYIKSIGTLGRYPKHVSKGEN